MTSPSTERSRNPAKASRRKRGNNPDLKTPQKRSTDPAPVAADAAAVSNPEPKTTKQERVLTLLSRRDGASIEEMMQATGWQQHSVRGFLAGMVRKKLGLSLTSSKAEGGARRYRIEPQRSK